MRVAAAHVPVRRGAWLAAAALVCGLIGAGSAAAFGVSVRADDYRDDQGVIGFYYLPTGSSTPLPAVVIVHDSLGIDARVRPYGEQIAAAGIAMLELDLSDLTSGDTYPTAQWSAALIRAAAALSNAPRIDPSRIAVLGFGLGARAAAMSVAAAGAGPDPFAARVLLYPGCRSLLAELRAAGGDGPAVPMALVGSGRHPSPVLLLHGDRDPANAVAECEALAAEFAPSGTVRKLSYPGAGYAWDLVSVGDTPMALPWPGGPGRIETQAWPELTEMSAAQVAGYLAVTLSSKRK
jgi:dienelactone hydrolase